MKNKTVGDIPQKKSFSHDQLWAALRNVEDLMERVTAPMFLLGDTGKQCLLEKDLDLVKIGVGLRKPEFTEQREKMIKELLTEWGFPFMVREDGLEYEFKGVPIQIKVFQKEYEFFKNLDSLFYLVGNYKIPNPFDKYYQARYILK